MVQILFTPLHVSFQVLSDLSGQVGMPKQLASAANPIKPIASGLACRMSKVDEFATHVPGFYLSQAGDAEEQPVLN